MSNTPKTDAFLKEYYDNDMYFGEESTQDMAEFARGLERQLEEQDVLLKAYSEALRTHPNPNLVQTVIDTALSGYKKLLPQHSQYRKLKEQGK